MAAAAQLTFNATTDPSGGVQNAIGGVPAFDLIHLDGLGPGVPLRKGNIVPGSERIQLGNEALKAGTDYGMDYVSGVIYLKRAIRPGMSLTVFYHYDDKAVPPPPDHINGISAMKLELIPGQFSAIAGLGMAERSSDGTVATSNLFGFNSNFSAGGSTLTGLFLFSQKKKVDSQGLMGFQGAQSAQPTGKSDLIVQNLATKVGKGSITANYQDISQNFTDFGSALAAGYDAKVVDQLAKEKGLKRMAFGFNDIQMGSLGISDSFKSIKDGGHEIDWRSFGLKQSGFAFSYNSQHVGKGFTRFNDLSEADKAQLAKEAGMDRQTIGLDLTQKFGKLSFADKIITDGTGSSIDRKEFSLDSAKFKFLAVDQRVGQTFTRIGSVMPNEQAMYGAELGVHRQSLCMDAALTKGLQPVHFAMTDLSTKSGGFSSMDFSAGGKTWSLEHSDREVDKGFTTFGALNAEADSHVKAISNMYQKDPIALRPDDKGIFLRTPDVRHDFTRISLSPNTGFNIMAQRMEIKTSTSTSFVDTASLATKHFNFNYRQENLGANLDPNALMLFERDRLGILPGLNRTDLSLTMDLGGAKTLSMSKTDATVGANSMDRTTAEYKDKKIDIQAGVRNVSLGFSTVNQLVDPEKDFLATLVGYREHDLKMSWQVAPNLKLEGYSFDSNSDEGSQQKQLRNLLLDWKPDKKSDFSYYHYENHSSDPTALLFANVLDRITFFKDFGKLGKFSYSHEKQAFDGNQTQQPDSEKQSFTYEAQLDNRTSVKAEEVSTKYDNGDKEETSTKTISRSVTKSFGVSVSDVNIDRPGTTQDQKKQNYGFWLDFGHGLRFNYGHAMQIDPNCTYTQNQMSLTGGTVGNWNVGNGGYTNNFWSGDNRTQTTTQFALGTVKPMRMGLLKDVTLNLGWDTAADRSIWLKENKIFSFAGKLGSNQIGFDYRSQVLQTNQRGIDRVFTFKSDPNEKKWLRGSLFYKMRTMPDGKQIMIRNMAFTARLTKGLELTNAVLTNPEQPNGGVLLGSTPLADRKNSWKLDYKPTGQQNPYRNQVSYGANWDELINDQNKTLARTGGATIKINFANSKSIKIDDPVHSSLTLFYGVEQNDSTVMRRLAQRYSLQFDQRPGPNQILSFLIGNLSYEHSIADGFHRDNWTARLDYQFKF
jgi:hypothetical protein